MSRVIVFGGAGRTGSLIARRAATAGHTVAVASRRRSSPGGDVDGIRSVSVDVTRLAAVAQAVDGQDAIILAVSTPARHPDALYSRAARNVVAAAAPGTRLIAISSGGVAADDPQLPFFFRRIAIPLFLHELYDDMREMEATIRESALGWTIVRGSWLRDDAPTGRFRVDDGHTPRGGQKLDRADLAEFVVAQLDSDEWLRRTPTLAA